jgi:hypothetical protein
MLVLLPDKSPSIAIRQIVENNRAWTLDCAYFVQVAHLYAVSQSEPQFDNRWAGKEFRLRVHFSSGAGVDQIKYFFNRKKKSAHWMVTKDGEWQWKRSNWRIPQILDAMRPGSRVMWTNDNVRPDERDLNRLAFRNENTVKIGNDRYLAFPISRPLSATKIRLILADHDLGRGRRPEIANARDDADARRAAGPELQNHANQFVFLKEALCFRRP